MPTLRKNKAGAGGKRLVGFCSRIGWWETFLLAVDSSTETWPREVCDSMTWGHSAWMWGGDNQDKNPVKRASFSIRRAVRKPAGLEQSELGGTSRWRGGRGYRSFGPQSLEDHSNHYWFCFLNAMGKHWRVSTETCEFAKCMRLLGKGIVVSGKNSKGART
jgi:hypothetical protein